MFDSLTYSFPYPEVEENAGKLKKRKAFVKKFNLPIPEEKIETATIYTIPQSLQKFHPSFDIVLSRLLNEVSNSYIIILFNEDRILWKNKLFTRLKEFSYWKSTISSNKNSEAKERIDMSRILFIPNLQRKEFFDLLDISTCLLDQYPFGGGVTSLEGFARNKPIVTLPHLQTVPGLTSGMILHMQHEWNSNVNPSSTPKAKIGRAHV